MHVSVVGLTVPHAVRLITRLTLIFKKVTTTLILQDMFPSINNRLQLKVVVTMRILIYVDVTI